MSDAYRLKTNTLTVNVRQEGSGPPLLYLGGSNFDLSIKTPVFDSALTTRFTVIAADYRGLGNTDAPLGKWTMQHYVQDAIALLDALDLTQVDILGESFGAMTAMHLAAQAPARVQRLALAAGSSGGEGGSSYPIHQLLAIDDPYLRAEAALNVLDTRFSALQQTSPKKAEALIRARIEEERIFRKSHHNAEGYPRLLAARATHNAWSILPKIAAPTLVLSGQHDGQAPPSRADRIMEALPNAALHRIDGAHGHCFSEREPVSIILDCWAS